ncbi:gamma-glutamyl-gamma-aminobutyrate hydrolase family protein [Pseudoduganella chitinolytica]|uniref:Gamma-glutamyl-gamma-aminobutyrate hydrolase family protein n=1 Tax=Pseudoduganella chitinolytica TaxID=34070 RepID=A0ABY8B8Y3_9BURK|nr:gamma-glutamyl-gamma-aminobutyrate hydrolase family protein [Pseudoduganella chitinolytica]WEF31503.1 gamma-glutamyl-gamma-aminobutyrate hydrolase family protein [Pseudoduganella chitinolytica]
MRRPIVLVPACTRQIGHFPNHAAQNKYVNAVALGAKCMPLILPALAELTDMEAVLAVADGVMLTGSASNVHADLYGQPIRNPALPLDAARDATTLPLIRAAVKRGIPLLGICRGFQEINVALGGTLHQAVQELPGMMDHRDREDDSLDVQYGPAHPIRLTPGGKFAQMLGNPEEIMVNSLHGQGVDVLAPGLTVEAVAHDGLVEAYTVDAAQGFTLAVQWHPEWRITENPDSMKMFLAFGNACREYQARRQERG